MLRVIPGSWIDSQIRSKKFPNCNSIAENFEISRRQAARDIEYLRYSMGAPLDFDSTRNGYYYSDETFLFPSILVSEKQIEGLTYLASIYEKAASPFAQDMARLFLTLSQNSGRKNGNPSGLFVVNPYEIESRKLIEIAIREIKKVEIEYENSQNMVSERIVHPYLLSESRNKRLLLAFCEVRNEVRFFRLDRIRKIRILEEPFERPVDTKINKLVPKMTAKDFRKP